MDFLVATDAIGMGLNLDIQHVAFAADMKFDGKQLRHLTPAEMAQIAGRAGRYKRDGTFGITAGIEPFSDDVIEQLETHQFAPVKVLQWRSREYDLRSLDALRQSLEVPAQHKLLTNIPTAKDQLALDFLQRHPNIGEIKGREQTSLAWDCAQIPDYRSISPAQHGEIIATIFQNLGTKGYIFEDWMDEQVSFCDNSVGDIDTLSNRIKQIRTWTFVANRKDWLKDPTYWREKTSEIENNLSDALHERLTQRFVDRRTSVLLRHLRDKNMTTPEISQSGDVSLEGHKIGSIEGFRFNLSPGEGDDAKNLRTAAGVAIAPEIKKRAEKVTDAPNDEFVLATDGLIRWRGEVIADLAQGDDMFRPRAVILADESLSGAELEAVQERITLWLKHHVNTLLEPLLQLREPTELEGTARGVAYQIAEKLGVLPRQDVAQDVKALDQDVRGIMRKMGVKFGAYHIYVPLSLKPAPRELALVLWALQHGGVRQPGVSELPQIILSGRTSIDVEPSFAKELYEIAGFKVVGQRAVRVDILERLADLIRPLISFDPARNQDVEAPEGAAPGNGFRVTVEMTSLLGCAGEEFTSVLKSLGYRVNRTKIEAKPVDEKPVAEGAEAPAKPEEAPTETSAAAEPSATPEAEQNAEPAVAVNEATGEADATAEAEEQFDEIWFPGGRNNNRKPQGAKQGAKRPAKGQKRGKPQQGKGPNRHANQNQRPAKKEKPIDPDSPFAALMALKKQ